jgi:outer membrane protein OmpA-like peptidoglycan-associated protein
MKEKKIVRLFGLAAPIALMVGLGVSAQALAADTPYAHTARDMAVTNSYGECYQTGDGKPNLQPCGTPQTPPPPPPPQSFVVKGVNFAFDSSKLTGAGEAVLDQAAPAIKKSNVKYEVGGHTDARGTDKYNQALSERRANTVYQGLVKRGVPANQLSARGYGESKPVATNNTDAGRAENRRVEINPVK